MQSNCKGTHDGCLEILESICEEIGSDMQSTAAEKIQTHIKYCPGCEAYLKSLEKTIETYKSCKEELPKDLFSKVLDRIQVDLK